MKRTLIAVLAINVILSPTAFADSKSRASKAVKVAVLKCAATKATGHAPKDVAPAQKLPKKLPQTFTFDTNCGNIVVTTVGARAPITITQLATLAKGGYFDNSLCHRLTTQGLYVLQCGDPTATGSGGPNFSYRDENLPQSTEANYPAGVVAMANSGANTNGSQFFIVYEDTSLPPSYTIWGKVTQGLDIVQSIAKEGVVGGKSDGLPKRTIAIEKVKVR